MGRSSTLLMVWSAQFHLQHLTIVSHFLKYSWHLVIVVITLDTAKQRSRLLFCLRLSACMSVSFSVSVCAITENY